jgi:hypothetical protein
VGCAKTLGEEAEQFFAYWAKFAFTTRNKSLAGEGGLAHSFIGDQGDVC